MASKEHWEVDPWDERAMWLKVIAQEKENPSETKSQAEHIFEAAESFRFRNGAHCLEIGAGVGRLLKFAARYFSQPLGVDSSISMVAISTRYLLQSRNCRVILNDGLNLPFPNNFFHFVYSLTCFQHMPELRMIQQNLLEAHRVLRTGGLCKIQTVCGDPESGRFDGHVFPTAEAFAQEFRQVGFQVNEAKILGPWIWVTAEK